MKKIISMVMCIAMLLGLLSSIPGEEVKAATYVQGGDTTSEAVEWDTDDILYGGVDDDYCTKYWAFTSDEEVTWYYFKSVRISGGVSFKVLDENNDVVAAFGQGSDDYGNYAQLEPYSVYYLAATSNLADVSEFEVTVTTTKDDFTSTFDKAGEVVSGKKYTAYLDSPLDNDCLYFVAGAKESSFTITGSETSLKFVVYSEDGAKVNTSESNSQSEVYVSKGSAVTAAFDTKVGEKYFILVETLIMSGFSSATFGKYVFTNNSKEVVPLEINATVVTMKKGMSFNVTGLLTDGDGEFTFSTSKKSVASISKIGVINAKKTGKATITVKNADGDKVKLSLIVK